MGKHFTRDKPRGKICSESVTVEMTQFVRLSRVISEGKSMWHCKICLHSGDVSGTIYGQLFAGQFLGSIPGDCQPFHSPLFSPHNTNMRQEF